jgi:type III secretory pathway component EscS
MNHQLNFIVKILIVSAILSLLVKYGGPVLPLEPSSFNAFFGIFVPPTIMGLALWWRENS